MVLLIQVHSTDCGQRQLPVVATQIPRNHHLDLCSGGKLHAKPGIGVIAHAKQQQ